ncbi:MAG: peptide deformylase [Rickettsiales bacterium]|jgi:peptide deformylase|nr:peptide deformylase [Rickettsiales bacterium]
MGDLNFLRKQSRAVGVIDESVLGKLEKMLGYMYENNGIALAANQIKIFERMLVIDLQENNRKNPLFLINPKIVEKSEEKVNGPESCISIKNITANVDRHNSVTIEYLDKNGESRVLNATGLLSVCIQHGVDLLDGIVFLDRVENKTPEIQRAIDKINTVDNSELKVLTIVDNMDFLRRKSSPVTKVDEELVNIMQRMLDVMYNSKGVGLAGVQVGILKRIIVIDIQEDKKKSPIFLINPEIIDHSENVVDGEEGCLSVPEERESIKRYETVVVRYKNEKNKELTLKADGLLAVCLQHEIDHLDGIMFFDHLSKLKRDFLIKRIYKNYKLGK